MAMAARTRLNYYEVISPLGAGGMGEVYRAKDTRLDREVAIKVLPADFANDADRLKRFEQEARATSALNHPNILTVYDIGSHEGAPYIVAELLDGEELRAQLDHGALPVRKAIEYAQQITAGLSAAHEKGIVHRDLKPENLFVTKDGRVKILDFGLAKLKPQKLAGAVDVDAPTAKPLTDPGVVMGTVGYMSPEQVRGQEADHRSDIFSFGMILYEMLSGERAFNGSSMADLMSAILKEEPPELSETNAKISPQLDKIVRRCLEKKPEMRFHSAHDLGFALSTLTTPSGSRLDTATALPALTESLPVGKARWFGNARLAWLVAAVTALLLLVALPFAVAYFRRPQAETYPARFSLALPDKMSGMTSLALSPDGRRLAFVATHEGKRLIWVRPINALTAQPLAGTDDVDNLFWSPDSRFIGFIAGGKLKKIEATGGPAQTLCDAPIGKGGTWNREGVIVFALGESSALYRVAASGGVPVQVTTLDKSRDEDSHRWPQFLPDGRHFLYLTYSRAHEESDAVFVGSLDAKDRKLILTTQSSAAYCPPGYLLFVRERTLMAQEFDVGRLQLTGEAVPIAEQVGYEPTGNARQSYFAVSENGVLAYTAGAPANRNYVWFERSGKELGAVNPVGDVRSVTLSPDGKRAALDLLDFRSGTANLDIWLVDLERNTPTRFTFHPAFDNAPVWSPDGSRIVFSSSREGGVNIYQKLSSGAGSEELLLKSDVRQQPTDWSSDGRYILFTKLAPKTREDLWVLPLFGDQQPFPFLATEFRELDGRFSPDGHWIAYTSNESGRSEVYVQSFPAAGGKKQISTGGGTRPIWRRDGRELLYLSPERKLISVEVKPGASFEYGLPKPLFDTRLGTSNSYAVSPDGQRFLLNVPVGAQVPAPINVVTNWMAELKR